MTYYYTDIIAEGLFCTDFDGRDQADLATAIADAERGLLEIAGSLLQPDCTIRASAVIRNEGGVVARSTLVIASHWEREAEG